MRQAQSESDKREKRALERKLSEMEEELRVSKVNFFFLDVGAFYIKGKKSTI